MRLEELLKTYEGKLSLKKVSDTLGACYQFVLKKSKEPVKGEVYDPSRINYEAVEAVLNKKGNLEDYNWEEIVSSSKIYEPLNDLEEFEVGTEFRFRYDDKEVVRTVVFKNHSYIVHIKNTDEKPAVHNNDTFLHQSPRVIK